MKTKKERKNEALEEYEKIREDHVQTIFNEIKAEAVKRAKKFKEYLKIVNPDLKEYWQGRFDEVIIFNNITEEDLK